MALPGLFWIELGLGVALLLLSAKAHGRQIRLERELEGYMEADFMGENPPWVEALWRKDRRRFWATFPVAAVVLSATGLLTLPPRSGSDPIGYPVLGAILLAGILWALVATLASNGLQSAQRLRTALNAVTADGARIRRVRRERGPWLREAVRGPTCYGGRLRPSPRSPSSSPWREPLLRARLRE